MTDSTPGTRPRRAAPSAIRVYAAISLSVFVGLAGYTTIRIVNERNRSLDAALASFDQLNQALTTAYLVQRSVTGPQPRRVAADWLSLQGGPDAILIESALGGVAFATAHSADRLLLRAGEPVAIAPASFVRILGERFRGAAQLELKAAYPLLHADVLFPVVRSSLYAVILFILLSGIAFLILSILRGPAATPRRAAPPAPVATRAAPPGSRAAALGRARPAAASRPTKRSAAPATARLTSLLSSTGISHAEFLSERLDSELQRSGALDAELCLALVHARGVSRNRQAYLQLGGILREMAVVADLAFEYGTAGFALIMPETELSAAMERLGHLRSRYERQGGNVVVAIGVSERGGRLIDGRRIFGEAKHALQRAVAAGGNQLVGFRADPVKFRDLHAGATNR